MRIVEKLKLDMWTVAQLSFLTVIILLCSISLIIGSMKYHTALPLIAGSMILIISHLITRKKTLDKQLASLLFSARDSEDNGQLQSAMYYYNEAISIRPRNIEALMGKVRCYIKMKDRDKAISLSKKILTLSPDSADAHYLMGVSYFQGRMLEDAELHLKQALQINQTHPDAILVMGDLQKQLRKPEIAVEYYEKFLALSKDEKTNTMIREKIRTIKR